MLDHLKSSWYKYVIEIIVIVIGILIAFSLDSWNSRRKLKKVEVQALYGILEGLERLKEEVQYNIDDEVQAMNSCQYIIDNFDRNLGLNDSLKDAFTYAWFYTYLQPDYGPYEFLNNYNSSVISNSDLRNEITELYGLDLRATVSESNIRGAYIQSLLLKMDQWYQSISFNPYEHSATEPWDYQSLRLDRSFRFHLSTQMNESIRWSRELSGLEKHIDEMIIKVNEEIERLD